MLNSGRMIEMFGKNKDQVTMMHYEGLNGFQQDMPCSLVLTDNALTFTKIKPDLTATLQLSQIKSLEFLPEVNFLTQYHNTGIPTAKMGQKFYWVIKYTTSSGESNHVALWDVGNKSGKLMEALKAKIPPVSDYSL